MGNTLIIHPPKKSGLDPSLRLLEYAHHILWPYVQLFWRKFRTNIRITLLYNGYIQKNVCTSITLYGMCTMKDVFIEYAYLIKSHRRPIKWCHNIELNIISILHGSVFSLNFNNILEEEGANDDNEIQQWLPCIRKKDSHDINLNHCIPKGDQNNPTLIFKSVLKNHNKEKNSNASWNILRRWT